MRRRILWSQLRIGTAVTLGVVAIAGMIFFIDDFRDVLEERYTLHFYTLTTQTLRKRAPVWLAGQPVGYIGRLDFVSPAAGRPDRLRVRLKIDSEARPFITEGAVAQVTTASMLGEAVVNILPARGPGAPLPEGAELPTALEIDPTEATRRLAAVYDSLPLVVERWQEVFRQAVHGPGTVSRLIEHPGELRELHGNLTELAATFDTLGYAVGGLADVFGDPEVRSAIGRIGPRLDTLAGRWGRREGTLGGFATDTLLAARFDGILRSAAGVSERLRTGRGTLGRLLYDRALAEELKRTRAMLEELRRELSKPISIRSSPSPPRLPDVTRLRQRPIDDEGDVSLPIRGARGHHDLLDLPTLVRDRHLEIDLPVP